MLADLPLILMVVWRSQLDGSRQKLSASRVKGSKLNCPQAVRLDQLKELRASDAGQALGTGWDRTENEKRGCPVCCNQQVPGRRGTLDHLRGALKPLLGMRLGLPMGIKDT